MFKEQLKSNHFVSTLFSQRFVSFDLYVLLFKTIRFHWALCHGCMRQKVRGIVTSSFLLVEPLASAKQTVQQLNSSCLCLRRSTNLGIFALPRYLGESFQQFSLSETSIFFQVGLQLSLNAVAVRSAGIHRWHDHICLIFLGNQTENNSTLLYK